MTFYFLAFYKLNLFKSHWLWSVCEIAANGEFEEVNEVDYFATGRGGDLRGIGAVMSLIQNGVKWMATNHAQQQHPVDARQRISLKWVTNHLWLMKREPAQAASHQRQRGLVNRDNDDWVTEDFLLMWIWCHYLSLRRSIETWGILNHKNYQNISLRSFLRKMKTKTFIYYYDIAKNLAHRTFTYCIIAIRKILRITGTNVANSYHSGVGTSRCSAGN